MVWAPFSRCCRSLLQALDYLGSKLKVLPKFADRAKRRSKVDEARDVLAHVVLCHVPVPKYNFSAKVWAGVQMDSQHASHQCKPHQAINATTNGAIHGAIPAAGVLASTSQIAYIAVMMRRMLCACVDPSFIDDRDYYGNKRLELAGGLMSLLFEDLFKRLNSDIKRQADASLSKANRCVTPGICSFVSLQLKPRVLDTL